MLCHTGLTVPCSGKSGPNDQVALYYYYTSPLHWCTRYRNCKFHNSCPAVAHPCVSWALVVKCKKDFFLIPEINEVSQHARTISRHADGISRSVPAHFYPWYHAKWHRRQNSKASTSLQLSIHTSFCNAWTCDLLFFTTPCTWQLRSTLPAKRI